MGPLRKRYKETADLIGQALVRQHIDLASPALHAIVILFARDEAERRRCVVEHDKFIAQHQDVEVLSHLDLEAVPPFIYAHDHFGFRDRISQPVIEGADETPTPGSGPPLKAGEFILGYPDERGPAANLPNPEILSRNGKQVLGKISKMGQRDIRRLLIIGAMAVVRSALRKGAPEGSWLQRMLARKPRMLVAIALANKMARSVWAMLAKGQDFRVRVVAAS